MAGEIRLDTQGRVSIVTLSNPDKLNAMTRDMWRDLQDVFRQVQDGSEGRCVLVRGQGGTFCAGGDIAEYPDFRFDEVSLRAFHEDEVWGGLSAILDCDVPVVAQIDGACMGAGIEIASCCDLRIAGDSAKFGAPIAKLGFPMAPREAKVVARAAGELTLREMLLESAVLPAAEMKARGFLNLVCPDGETAARARSTAGRIASLSPQAARMNKQTLRAVASGANIAGAYRYADSVEHREGIMAFLEKRPPRF